MNQDAVKEKLVSLGLHETDFTLVFSGKQSAKVNGLYRPDTKEIIIHNQNFKNDNVLMFTALHEYTHHVSITRKLVKGKSAHPTIFWALFHSIISIAIEKGIYKDSFEEDPDLKAVDERVSAVVQEQIAAQRKLGSVLLEMRTACESKGARFEDYLDRHARIPKEAAKAAVTAQLELFGLEDATPQVVELISSISNDDGRSEAVARVMEGQTIAQVRAAVKQGKVIDPYATPSDQSEDEEAVLDRLSAQRKKLAEKIQDLTLELQSLDAQIATLREKLPHLNFDDDQDYEVVDDDKESSEADLGMEIEA